MNNFLVWLSVLLLVCVVIFNAKCLNARIQRNKISYAIYSYKKECLCYRRTCAVYWADMEHPMKTFCRLWDWSCKNILSKEKYEIIKEYIV